jgi:hypothetical protein
MKVRQQPGGLYAAVLVHRAVNIAVSILILILCFFYLFWEPVTEHLFAWMRWHLWGYPG